MTARRVALVTGTRAEYGLLRPLIEALGADPAFAPALVVTGAHLEPRFGETVRAIEADGTPIAARVPMGLDDDSPLGLAQAMARGLAGVAQAFDRLRPDLVVLLGDRYEMLCPAQAALLARIPLAHLHGGEASEGAMDEALRHALTKMAHLQFVAAEPYRRRVVQMGEDPARVFTVGALALDSLAALPPLPRDALEARLGLGPGQPFFLVTYHPATLDAADPAQAVEALAAGLAAWPGHAVVVTGVNADPGHDRVAAAVARWRAAEPGRVRVESSLGLPLYAAATRAAAAVVGNSSSGILEAPFLGTPTVNLGSRQQGRLRAASVLDCAETVPAIRDTVARALDPAWRAQALAAPYPFGAPGAAARIVSVLKTVALDGLLVKRFHDVAGGEG